ncbi:MAG TPA: tetratricopeptide repeat protein [Bryobacteraceae bacterium]|nr:tetratricopeptide repeat protein [Bryobacteraceae bacterium]HPQ13657.1 tetratricopeptide repeat protein [Bryobacteraceae bacterium]HPU71332.1 tetratricopeptide repeat protein [Bryobacteraceae bacterium]
MARAAMLAALCVAGLAHAQAPDPAARAYEALRARDYDAAVPLFLQALRDAPARAALRKDLAYTYLKMGETEAARDEFAEVLRLDPSDENAALEYAFLCHETRKTAEARRLFERLRNSPDAAIRAKAAEGFENIDRPLAEGIQRWSEVVAAEPGNFSARLELARLAEQRGLLRLAAENYLNAWRLRPDERSLLVDLGRVLQLDGRDEEAFAPLLAASRGSRPRAAEEAREMLPLRYPYVSEFRQALAFDPQNIELRRELGYLLLEMGWREEAEAEFKIITEQAPKDYLAAAQLGLLLLDRGDREAAVPLLQRALETTDEKLRKTVRTALGLPPEPPPPRREPQPGPREMGERSFRAGYLKDALKYYSAALEADPVDFPVMMRLGQVHNLLRQDEHAIHWFDLARQSPDPALAAEARKAYRNLRPGLARFRTTAWLFPFYSTRWKDVFSYGQVKTDLRLGKLPFRPYVSLRFIGDTRGTTGGALPQYLSESSFILGAGIATASFHGASLWAEAGQAISYLGGRSEGRMLPDYRGGIAFSRAKGQLLGGEAPGWFAETTADGVFISRFNNDFIVYLQNRIGYTPPSLSGLQTQLYANANFTTDVKREYWANFVEFGPGLRFRWEALPPSLVFSVNLLRGVYTNNAGNPRDPNFFELRAGFWYAFSR